MKFLLYQENLINLNLKESTERTWELIYNEFVVIV